MTQEALIDYAYPLMKAETAMKKAYAYLLEEDHVLAMDQLTLAVVEAKIARNAIQHMMEQKNALHKKPETV